MKIPTISLSVKYSEDVKQSELTKLNSSNEVYEVVKKCFNPDTFLFQEQFIVLMLNNSNKVLGFYPMSIGGLSSTIVDIRLIFSTAIKTLATSIILAHNHPSGSLQPSQADKSITQKVKEAGQLLDIRLLDHLIVTDESYFSFADEGEL